MKTVNSKLLQKLCIGPDSDPKDSVYYIPTAGKLISLENIKWYQDMNSDFIIATWSCESGTYKKTLITSDQYNRFVFVGDL